MVAHRFRGDYHVTHCCKRPITKLALRHRNTLYSSVPHVNIRLVYECELHQSQRKSTQVGGQTKCKLNASRKLSLTFVDLRVHLTKGWNYFCLFLIVLNVKCV